MPYFEFMPQHKYILTNSSEKMCLQGYTTVQAFGVGIYMYISFKKKSLMLTKATFI